MRPRIQLALLMTLASAVALLGQVPAPSTPPLQLLTRREAAAAEQLLRALAADSMEGREAGTAGARKAARLLAQEFHRAGLSPGGDSGYFQRVPFIRETRPDGVHPLRLASSWTAFDSVPANSRVSDDNVVAVLKGRDPTLRREAVVVSAHYDHLGIGKPVNGDSIYNGADDDASGTTAVVTIAKALARGPRPRRTIVFLATTAEEDGALGTRWYVAHPTVPLKRTVVNINIEMIGRPDSLVGPGRAWLTGYERSTLGAQLVKGGIRVAPDQRPFYRFFERSDNIEFAWEGIPAHTLSSYNLHQDYHARTDEAQGIDFSHLASVIDAAARAVRLVANGSAPKWNPGGRPEKE